MANYSGVQSTARQGFDAARHSGWLEWLTRIGFASKGVVYFLIGMLALMLAFQEGGETTGSEGVLRKVAGQPFGEFALIVIGIGMLAYAFWRLMSAVKDTDDAGSDAKGKAKRVGYFISSLLHGSLAMYAFNLVAGNGGGGAGDGARSMTARLMDAPMGVFLVIAVGIVVIVTGIAQINHGWQEKFMSKLGRGHMSATERTWARRAGKWGYVARGCVFSIIGLFLVIAGINHDPGQARGLEGSLDTLASQPAGSWLLAFVAAGLCCYGIYCVFAARHREVKH
jgi:hypothetical protein